MKWKGEKRRTVGKFGSGLDGQISLKCPNIPSIYYDNGDFLPVLTTAHSIVKAPQLNTFKVIFRVKNFLLQKPCFEGKKVAQSALACKAA